VSTAEHSNEGLAQVWDLIVGGESLNERAGRHPARQRDVSTLHFRREEISHRHIRRCVGNDQHGRRDLDEPHHFTSPNRQASKRCHRQCQWGRRTLQITIKQLTVTDSAEKVVIFQRFHHWKHLAMLDQPESAAIAAVSRS
jgi:hypothetical protein